MSDLSEGLESDNSAQGPVTMLRKSELSNPVKVGMLRPSLFSAQLGGGGISATTTTAASSSSSSSEAGASSTTASTSGSNNDLNKSSTTATANPTNIFLKVPDDDDDCTETKKQTPDGKKEETTNLLKKNCPNVQTLAATTIPLSESSGHFVFGQNIHERVVGENIQKPSSSDSNAGEASGSSTTSSDTGMLFSSALHSVKSDGAEAAATPKETDSKSLSEVARVYEESRAQKRKYDEVETFTGEENEINIIELNCKIFAFVNGNWEERGRGSLRLNDAKDNSCSRVVFRTSGNLRLLVNTKIWPGMVLQRPSQKSIRITAMDNMNQIKIFLFMSRPDDIAVMYNALQERVNKCKENDNSMENNEQQHNGDSTSSNGNNRDDDPEECDEPSPKKATLVDN